ncbi:MAG: diguanylate cyclase [Deltaproteobacteria bacterium]|nr:diguanylate cyclase [Deltaproteobacteria bacterium]MBW2218303.1 diguanylate cyclase [Deltaproteobacteria bacterium]
MLKRISIVFPIIGMTVLIVLAITSYFYYIEVKALKDTLLVKENSKAEDIYFIVESLIDREENKLRVLAITLKKHTDLMAGLSHFRKSKGDITALKTAMDDLFLDIGTDIFQVADINHRIIYKAHAPFKKQEIENIPGVNSALFGGTYTTAIQTEGQWAIVAITPALYNEKIVGSFMIGTWIDNNYAKKIAFETEVHMTFGSLDGIIASSLPFDERPDIDTATMRKSIQDVNSIRIELPDKFKVIHYSPTEIAEKLFSVMVEINTEPSYNLVEDNRKHFLKLSLIVLITAVSLGAIFTLYLVSPLKKLRQKAKQTVMDISGLDLKESGRNEIQSLIRFFDTLVTTAINQITERKEAEEALKKHQEHLEEKIEERTAEHRETNKKLLQTVAELEKRTNETILFSQIGGLFQACDTEEETYNLVERFCKKLFPKDSGYFSIYDKHSSDLRVVASWGDNMFEDTESPANECWSIRLSTIHIVKNIDIDPLCPHLKNFPARPYICAPMIAQGELLGMLHLTLNKKIDQRPKENQEKYFDSKKIVMTSLLEHYAPPLTSLRLRETLRIQSIHDPLTGLFNRRHMQKTLQFEAQRAIRHGISLGIIMIDVDHFKKFNDTYSHEAGDIILKELGAFLKKSVRQEDIACRFGGEEFVLILPETSLEDSKAKAEALRLKTEDELKINYHGRSLSITISLGVAAFPEHGQTTDEVINASDRALYLAKSEGRNRIAVA